jgi:hypothetical protein
MLQLARKAHAVLCCCTALVLVRGCDCVCGQRTRCTARADEGSTGLTLWCKATPYPSWLPAHGPADALQLQGATALTPTPLQTHVQALPPEWHWLLLICAMHAASAIRRLHSVLAGAGGFSAAAAAAVTCCICYHVEVKGTAGSHQSSKQLLGGCNPRPANLYVVTSM